MVASMGLVWDESMEEPHVVGREAVAMLSFTARRREKGWGGLVGIVVSCSVKGLVGGAMEWVDVDVEDDRLDMKVLRSSWRRLRERRIPRERHIRGRRSAI